MGLFRRRSKDLFTIAEQDRVTPAPSTPPPSTPPPSTPPPIALWPRSGFTMVVEDVFVIRGRGTVVTGRVGAGTVSVGDRVRLERAGAQFGSCEVGGIEQFRKVSTPASAGENVGVLLRDVGTGQISRGDVLRA